MIQDVLEKAMGKEAAKLVLFGNQILDSLESGSLSYDQWLAAILKGRDMAVSEKRFLAFLHAQISAPEHPEWMPQLSRDLAKEGIEIGSYA